MIFEFTLELTIWKSIKNSEGFEIDQRFEHPSFEPYLPGEVVDDIEPMENDPRTYNNIAILKLKKKISFDKKVKPALFYGGPNKELKNLTLAGFSPKSGVLEKIGNLAENCTLSRDGYIFGETSPELSGKLKGFVNLVF